jgi:hypothetical protein
MLYVVAWPVLAEADDTALRRLRARYHPKEADLIGPHGAARRPREHNAAAVLVHARSYRAA